MSAALKPCDLHRDLEAAVPRSSGWLRRLARGRVAAALLSAPAWLGAPPAPAQPVPGDGFALGAGASHHPARDLDGGGEASVTSTGLGLSHRWRLHPGAVEAGLRVESDDWTFDAPGAFGGVAPWGRLNRVSLGVGWQQPIDRRWRLGLRASLGLAGEEGADLGESRTAGVTATVLRVVSDDLSLGAALSVSRDIGRQRVRLLPLIDWRFADRWRLGSVAPGSAAVPAGLELGYRLDPAWDAALGIGTSERRYRLDDAGPTGGGIAESHSRPVFARLGWAPWPGHRFELVGGVDSGGELRLEDRERRLVDEVDLERGPFIGLGWSSRF